MGRQKPDRKGLVIRIKDLALGFILWAVCVGRGVIQRLLIRAVDEPESRTFSVDGRQAKS